MAINSGGYLVLTPAKLKKAHTRACEIIRNNGLKFTSIAFSGYSGALVAPAVAARLNKRLIIVRKKGSKHHGIEIEGEDRGKYIILDDFISCGDTVKRILKANEKYRPGLKCVGIILYSGYEVDPYIPAYERKAGQEYIKGIPVYRK